MGTLTPETIIGTIHVPANTIHDASYETAAWYRTFEHPEQKCTIRRSGKWMLYTIEGRTTHKHFPALFGGVATGGGTMGDCDEPSTYTMQMYEYVIAAMVEAGEIDLDPRYQIVERYHDHPVSCVGYVTDHSKPIGHRYSPCGHELHLDAHCKPTKTERNERGFLSFGYVPGVVDRKRHISIVRRSTVNT